MSANVRMRFDADRRVSEFVTADLALSTPSRRSLPVLGDSNRARRRQRAHEREERMREHGRTRDGQ
jgi:hypothetical protein